MERRGRSAGAGVTRGREAVDRRGMRGREGAYGRGAGYGRRDTYVRRDTYGRGNTYVPRSEDLGYEAYSRDSYMRQGAYAHRRKRRSALPVVVALLAIVLVGGAAGFAAWSFANSGQAGAPGGESALDIADSAAVSDAAPVAENVVMTLDGDKETYVLVGEKFVDGGCLATDKNTGPITDTITVEGSVDTSKPGDYKITYVARTADGAEARAERNVHVVESFSQKATTLPVLMYHYVYTKDDVPSDLNNNYILDTKLEAECDYLKENGYYFPSFDEVRAFVDGTHSLPAKSVVMTFDDAEPHFLAYGLPILNERQIPATTFLICSDDDAAYKVREFATEYVQFQSHTYDMHHGGSGKGQGGIIHAMSKQEIYDDLMQSKEVLGVMEAVAYPFGDNNETAWAAFEEAGVQVAFTVKNARISPGDNPMALNRVRISGEYSVESFINSVSPNG